MSNEKTAYIYILRCPNSGDIRYVGKTVNPKSRYAGHLSYVGKTYVSRWIMKLRSNSQKPIMEIIEECDKSNWESREQHWIAYYRNLACDLTNLNGGGGGQFNASQETRQRIAQSLLGVPKKIEAREKQSQSTLGVKKSDAHRKSISEARKNANPEHNRRIGERLKKPINQYSLDGEFIKTWGCAKDAENAGVGNAEAIGQCARGTSRMSAGYIWRYVNE